MFSEALMNAWSLVALGGSKAPARPPRAVPVGAGVTPAGR